MKALTTAILFFFFTPGLFLSESPFIYANKFLKILTLLLQ